MACRAARACLHEAVATRGHVLRTADFIATLAVEAAVHYLDLTAGLPAAPAPEAAALGLVRRASDGLLGVPLRAGWGRPHVRAQGTGRVPVTEEERRAIGELASWLPLFG